MESNNDPDQSNGPAADQSPAAPGEPRRAVNTFTPFRRAVLEVIEQGEEVVVTKRVWTVEELVFRRRATERSMVVRDTVRTVDVDVDAHSAVTGKPGV